MQHRSAVSKFIVKCILDKKEVVFNENYLNKWVTFSGIVETIDGNSLGVNCDLQGTADINIEFEEIYREKIGVDTLSEFVSTDCVSVESVFLLVEN